MLTSPFAGSQISLSEKGGHDRDVEKELRLPGRVCAAAVFAMGVRGEAGEEVRRLAELMGWKAGTTVAVFEEIYRNSYGFLRSKAWWCGSHFV